MHDFYMTSDWTVMKKKSLHLEKVMHKCMTFRRLQIENNLLEKVKQKCMTFYGVRSSSLPFLENLSQELLSYPVISGWTINISKPVGWDIHMKDNSFSTCSSVWEKDFIYRGWFLKNLFSRLMPYIYKYFILHGFSLLPHILNGHK